MSQAAAGELWQVKQAKIDKILNNGAQKFFNSISDIAKAFNLEDKSIRCIDEGTPGGIHLAGSGILLNMDEAERVLQAAGATGIFTHEECGAAKLYAEQEGLDPECADEYCGEWANSLASNLKIPYRGQITIDEMSRPSGLHTARVAYYDGTGSFDYSAAPDLPEGFIVSRRYLSADYAKKELEISLSIAFGEHGFGHLFTVGAPFIVVALTDDEKDLAGLISEVRSVAAGNDRVRIEGVLIKSLSNNHI